MGNASLIQDLRTWASRPALLAVLAGLLWTLTWYWQTAAAMVGIWARSDSFTHAFLVPPIVAWLIWRQRQALGRQEPVVWPWGNLLLAAAGFAWLVGQMAAINALVQFALIALLAGLVPTLCGLPVARLIAFPLAFLFFAVPFGEFMMPTLMRWTADITVAALRLTGIPVYQEGLMLIIPSGKWSVVEACSGLRYLIASITVGTLFAYLNYRSTSRRLLFILVSLLVPLAANWVRAYLIVLLGHVSGNELAAGADHLIYGWVFFGLVIFLMFAIGARWAEPDLEAETPAPPTTAASAPTPYRLVAALPAAALIAAFPLTERLLAAANATSAPVLPAAIATAPDWQAGAGDDFQPAYAQASASLRQAAALGEATVGLDILYYRNQDFEHKLITSTNVLVTSQDRAWLPVRQERRTVTVAGQVFDARVTELASQSPGRPGLTVWQWYWIAGRPTADDRLAKLYTALARLAGQGDDSAAIFLHTERQAGADTLLERYLADHGDALLATLQAVRNRR